MSWDLDISDRLPRDRTHHPCAPFATLTTDPPEIAEAAWAYYRHHRGNAHGYELARFIGDAAITVPALETTIPYRPDIGDPPDSDPQALAKWQRRRRDWLCEFLIRYQAAYELTADSLAQYRQSGVVDRVEVVGDPERCSVCRAGFVGIHALETPIEIPHSRCGHPFGCMASVIPLLDNPLGEV